jgi:hypothetical protein
VSYECLIRRVRVLLAEGERASLLVFGGNPVVGKALQLLLSNLGYDARYMPQISFDKRDMLNGIQLLLFVGAVHAEQRANSASSVESVRDKVDVPILKLASSTRRTQAENEKNLVAWPCRMDELKRRIDAALPDGYFPERKSGSYG